MEHTASKADLLQFAQYANLAYTYSARPNSDPTELLGFTLGELGGGDSFIYKFDQANARLLIAIKGTEFNNRIQWMSNIAYYWANYDRDKKSTRSLEKISLPLLVL